MDEFSKIGLAQDPKIEISKKKMDEFSSNTVWFMTRKTVISEKILNEFSRIWQ